MAPWLIAAVGQGVVETCLVCGVMGVNSGGHSSYIHRAVNHFLLLLKPAEIATNVGISPQWAGYWV